MNDLISPLQVIINDMDWLVKMDEYASPETLDRWAGELARIENDVSKRQSTD